MWVRRFFDDCILYSTLLYSILFYSTLLYSRVRVTRTLFCESPGSIFDIRFLSFVSIFRLHIHPLTINKRKEISYHAIWRLYLSSISYGDEKIKKLKSLIIRQSFDCLWKLCRNPNYIEHTNKFEQIKTPLMEETAKFLSVGFSTFGASSKARIII